MSLVSLPSAKFSERVLGDFVLRELVGAGGFGDVYLAEQVTLRREAVVKVLRPGESHEHRVEAFLREAKLASQLDHPYAAHIYAFGAEPDGVCWIAMELVRGASLRATLEAQGPMSLERFVPLLERVCEVVHTAHDQGIVHRDLKPDNVMVISRAGRLLPKLVDFGIAHTLVDASASKPDGNDLTGSPQYMAPELWVDPICASSAADQYALGALAYEALTGRMAFPGRTRVEIARAHARPSRRPIGNGVPSAVDAVIDRALARRASDRYTNVLEFAQALREASGLGQAVIEIPQLDEDLRLRLLAHAPQPIADAVAAYDAAKNAHQAREALRALARIVAWYVALLALACRTRIGSGGSPDSDAARALISDLRRHGLTFAGWIGLARQLTLPFVGAPDTYPLPELVGLLHPRAGGDVLATILEGSLPESLPDTSAEAAVQAIARELPQVTTLLRATLFLLDYQLVVSHGGRGEAWMGMRGSKRTVPLARALPDGVALVSDSGVPLLVLSPLFHVAVAVPGHGDQLFMLAGPGRQGARLVSAPHGFEHHDAAVWEWFRDELFERIDDDTGIAAGNPYRGLSSYRVDDAGWFFGRERESEAMVNRLKLEAFVAVVGPSGVGKSSFVHAGVAPALGWRVVGLRPGRSPLVQLAAQLATAGITAIELVGDDLATVAERLRAAAGKLGGLLIVVDQFEELFTLGSTGEERERFVRVLLAATTTTDSPLRVVITLRDDFLIRAEQLPGLGPALARGIQLLGPLGSEALARIVVEPARRAGFTLEDPELPARMVAAVAGVPAAVALISFTATRLWELRDRHFRQLSAKAYDAIGGVTGALARHADETLEALPVASRQLARKAFRHLVTSEGTRAVLEREELHQLLGAGLDVERLIDRLVDARLLATSESDRGTGVIEIIHEALIREWPRLVEWRRDDVEGQRFHEQLRSAARQWHDRGRPRGLLWRGDALAEYQLWRRHHADNLTPTEAAFGAASVADAARGRRIRRGLVTLAIAIAAVFAVAQWRANRATGSAKREAERLLRESYFEQGRLRVLEGDNLAALSKLAAAHRMGDGGDAVRLLFEEAARPTRARVHELVGHGEKLWDVAYSPDGKWLATASSDGTARLWDGETGALRTTMRHTTRAIDVAFSADSRLVVSGGHDPVIRVWDVTAGREIAALPVAAATLNVAFSGDGVLMAASRDRSIKLWRFPGGAPLGELSGLTDIQGARFCGDGSCVAGFDSIRVIVWDTATLAPRVIYQPSDEPISIAVSRTGDLLAIGTIAGELILLRRDGSVIARAVRHDDRVLDIALSPDESVLATGSSDRTVRLWTPAGEPLGVLVGHRATITRVRFTPAGDRVVTMSGDNTARLWTLSGMLLGELAGHSDIIMAAAIRPDGRRLATASWDHRAIVWDLARVPQLRPITTARDRAPAKVSFDPGGSLLAVARGDGSLAVADVATGATLCSAPGTVAIKQLTWTGGEQVAAVRAGAQAVELWHARSCARGPSLDHPAPITVVSERSSRRLITAAAGVVRVWRDGRQEASFTGYEGTIEKVGSDGDDVYAITNLPPAVVIDSIGGAPRRRILRAGPMTIAGVLFDREQGRVLGASWDQFLYFWDAATGEQMLRLETTGPLHEVRNSPDGEVTVGVGGLAPIVWDRTTGKRRGELTGHTDLVHHGDFIDDTLFVSRAWNRTALVSDLVTGRSLLVFRDVDEIMVSPDRATVALIGTTGVRLWSPRAPAPDLGVLRALNLE